MVDLKLTEEGDLVVGEDGDLDIVWGDGCIAQEILFRLKTTIGDWILSPDVGSNLEKFIGEPNIPLTHVLIESAVMDAVTRYNLVHFPTVNVIPIAENEVFILVEFGSVEEEQRVIQIQSGLDLRKGLCFARITSREL